MNRIEISYYESRFKVNYSVQEDYIHQQMEYLFTDNLNSDSMTERTTILRKHELEMQDSIWNPFDAVTDQ